MRVNLRGLIRQASAELRLRDANFHAECLDNLAENIEELVAGKHTLAEFAAFYCLDTKNAEK